MSPFVFSVVYTFVLLGFFALVVLLAWAACRVASDADEWLEHRAREKLVDRGLGEMLRRGEREQEERRVGLR